MRVSTTIISSTIVGLVMCVAITCPAFPQQWSRHAGGNGNFYDVVTDPYSWTDADLRAREMGGHLVTISSPAENDFAFIISRNLWSPLVIEPRWWNYGPWIGAHRPLNNTVGWEWVTGEILEPFRVFGQAGWAPDEPNNENGVETAVHFFTSKSKTLLPSPTERPTWNDLNDGAVRNGGQNLPFIIEYEDASLVFRKDEMNVFGSWGPSPVGWNHVALNLGNKVFESHSGYPTQEYTDADVQPTQRHIVDLLGVQQQHTVGTYRLIDLPFGAAASIEEVHVPSAVGEEMARQIAEREFVGAGFRDVGYSSLSEIRATWDPALQKGQVDNTFTSVGLIEWAAEEAGYNGGEGFVPDAMEVLPLPEELGGPLPVLSPQLLYWATIGSSAANNPRNWLSGLIDPADFILTDPSGRRLGYTPETGSLNEIPNAFYSGDGAIEQFLVLNPEPGEYVLELFGTSASVGASVGDNRSAESISQILNQGESIQLVYTVNPPGDYDSDGIVNTTDYDLWKATYGSIVSPHHGADGNGDGIVDVGDYTIWRDNFSGSTVAASLAGVPEPATHLMLLLGIALQSIHRRSSIRPLVHTRQI